MLTLADRKTMMTLTDYLQADPCPEIPMPLLESWIGSMLSLFERGSMTWGGEDDLIELLAISTWLCDCAERQGYIIPFTLDPAPEWPLEEQQ